MTVVLDHARKGGGIVVEDEIETQPWRLQGLQDLSGEPVMR